MSVRFNITFINGMKLPRSDACFGVCNTFPLSTTGHTWGMTSIQRSDLRTYLNSFPRDEQTSRIAHIEYLPQKFINSYAWSGTAVNGVVPPVYDVNLLPGEDRGGDSFKKRCVKNYLQMMVPLLADMPWWKGMITVHPIQGAIRCHTKGQPSDKMMTTLFALRNLAQSEVGRTYLSMIDKGYRPRIALMISLMMTESTRVGAPTGNFTNNGLGESSVLNPRTFGVRAATEFLAQAGDGPSSGWIQSNFNDERRGYLRDRQLQDDRVFFNENANDSTRYRIMIDVYSIVNDEPFVGSRRSGYELVWGNINQTQLQEQIETLKIAAGIA